MRLGFFPYRALHYKAAQAYLDKKAAQGLALQKIYLGCIALFQKSGSPKHFVDLNIIRPNERGAYGDVDPDYLELCTDAGWELVRELRGMLLFRAAQGKDPVPIQTDREIEWDRFWATNRPKLVEALVLLGALALLAGVLLLSPPNSWELTHLLLSNVSLLVTLYWALTLVFSLLNSLEYRLYLARCKKTDQVEQPGKLATVVDAFEQLRKWIGLPLIALILVNIVLPPAVQLRSNIFEEEKTATVVACGEYPTVRAYDLGLSDDLGDNYSRYLTGLHSLLCEYYNYDEMCLDSPGGAVSILVTEYYHCAWEPLAKWTFDRRATETRNGAFLWRNLEWEDAPGLGFDESYTYDEGSYLLLREGNVVAMVGHVGSGVDLTTPKNLQIIRQRLGLPAA